jgi:hypothetical protein
MKRNKFSLSHYKLCSMDLGRVVPLTWMDIIPGTTLQQATSLLCRVTPLATPVMHPLQVRIHHFFVPYRLLWANFETYITGGADGNDTTTHPYIALGTVTESSLADYLGVPPAAYGTLNVNALPFRAYAMIYDKFYRDQDLVTSPTYVTTDGADASTQTALLRPCWPKDYFTSARPDAMKGDMPTIPLGTGTVAVEPDASPAMPTFQNQAGTVTGKNLENANTGSEAQFSSALGSVGEDAYWDDPNLQVDLSGATSGIDINDLRLAFAIQKYKEARQVYGSRYTEFLRYLGINSSDKRAADPIYLGGGRQTIQFSEVLSTDGANTGTMYGHGITAMRSNKYRRFFEEHGLIMSMCTVLPKPIYANGLHRSWSRSVKEDYFQKELQHIGEQEILNKEVYSEHSSPDGTFGYQARYDEYRSMPSSIAGEFHSTLNDWHYGRIFSSDPSLNSTFVKCTASDRSYVSTATDPLRIMAAHSIQARIPMSVMGRPTGI